MAQLIDGKALSKAVNEELGEEIAKTVPNLSPR